jgi:arsenate reductase
MTSQPVAVTIYHNPACGTPRNTLALIRNAGVEPIVIEYLKTPPDRTRLKDLLQRMGMTLRALLREKGTSYAELGLGASHWTDEDLIDQMLAHPILINRPIVVTPWGVRLCRPSEVVLDILPLPQRGPFAKEDGEPLIDESGARIRRRPQGVPSRSLSMHSFHQTVQPFRVRLLSQAADCIWRCARCGTLNRLLFDRHPSPPRNPQ